MKEANAIFSHDNITHCRSISRHVGVFHIMISAPANFLRNFQRICSFAINLHTMLVLELVALINNDNTQQIEISSYFGLSH